MKRKKVKVNCGELSNRAPNSMNWKIPSSGLKVIAVVLRRIIHWMGGKQDGHSMEKSQFRSSHGCLLDHFYIIFIFVSFLLVSIKIYTDRNAICAYRPYMLQLIKEDTDTYQILNHLIPGWCTAVLQTICIYGTMVHQNSMPIHPTHIEKRVEKHLSSPRRAWNFCVGEEPLLKRDNHQLQYQKLSKKISLL